MLALLNAKGKKIYNVLFKSKTLQISLEYIIIFKKIWDLI